MAQNVCHLAALALPLWKSVEDSGKLQIRPEVANSRKNKQPQQTTTLPPLLAADGGHVWLPFGKRHRCAFCPCRTTTKHMSKPSADISPRNLGRLGEVLDRAGSTGHKLYWSVHQRTALRVLCCSACDAYATLLPKGLLSTCTPKERKPNWERWLSGRFPTYKFGHGKVFCEPFQAIVRRCRQQC